MVRQQLDITYTIVWSLALATIVGAAICILLSSQIAKITKVRFAIMAPLLFMMIAFAAFESRQSLGDLVALIAIGFVGILLRRFDYSRPAFLIGFVLSSQVENFTNMANQIAGARFQRSFLEGVAYIATPLSLGILALTVVSIVVGLRSARYITETDATASGSKRASVIFLLIITAYVLASVIDAGRITLVSDKIFPLTVGIVTLIACCALLIRMRLAPETDPIFIDLEVGGPDANARHGLWPTLFWFALLLALSCLVGFIIALAVFFLTFYRVRAGLSWAWTLFYSAAGVAAMIGFGWVLGRDFPPGLLQQYTDLPWPFR
jgi:hypothetical protein